MSSYARAHLQLKDGYFHSQLSPRDPGHNSENTKAVPSLSHPTPLLLPLTVTTLRSSN